MKKPEKVEEPEEEASEPEEETSETEEETSETEEEEPKTGRGRAYDNPLAKALSEAWEL